VKFRAGPALAVTLLFIAAAAIRLQGLSDIRQGFYQDEAISGIQALDLLSGTDRAAPFAPRMMFPLWTAFEAPSIALLGMTPGAVRLPAALAGIATLVLAFFAGRAVAGFYGAVGAAGFIAFSLWHLIYSRMGASPVVVPFLGMALAAVIFGPVSRRPLVSGLLAGLAAGGGLLSYFAGWSLPAVMAAGIFLRRRQDPEFRAVAGKFIAGALAGLVVCATALAVFPGSVRIGAPLVSFSPWGFAGGIWKYFLALFINPWPRDISPEIWGVYPPGTPFLSPVESLLVLGGIAVFIAGGRPRWRVKVLLAWVFLGLMPAAFNPAGLRYSRAIGVLVPLALLAAAVPAWFRSVLPRTAPWALSALLLVMAVRVWRGYFYGYQRDPRIAVWSNAIDVELAQYLVNRAGSSRVILLNPRSASAVLEFFASRETRSGRIDFRPGPSPTGVFETVIRDPAWNQPMMFVFRVAEREGPGETALLLANPDAFLGRATAAEARGQWRAAARVYREALEMFPDFGVAHWRLAGMLEKMGLKAEAEQERRLAIRLGVGGPGVDAGF